MSELQDTMESNIEELANPSFWKPRRCFLEPIPEIFEAAQLLDEAINAHLADDKIKAERLIIKADISAIADWTESIWGTQSPEIHRFRASPTVTRLLPKKMRIPERMPPSSDRKRLIARDGHHCRYCGIPVIRKEIRDRIKAVYPNALRWGRKNCDQHAAFQSMWLTYEHVLPHSRGGDNSFENMVVSCQPCNCGKVQYTLEELGLLDPRNNPLVKSDWDGLERFI